VWSYTELEISNRLMLVLGFPLVSLASGTFSPIGSFFTGTISRLLFAALDRGLHTLRSWYWRIVPALVGALSSRIPLAHAIGASLPRPTCSWFWSSGANLRPVAESLMQKLTSLIYETLRND